MVIYEDTIENGNCVGGYISVRASAKVQTRKQILLKQLRGRHTLSANPALSDALDTSH